jgi:hypothetical protein
VDRLRLGTDWTLEAYKVNRDDIIRMAREAGAKDYGTGEEGVTALILRDDAIERFFHMAQAAEREACAKVVENHALGYAEPVWAFKLIDTIRARGNT